MIYQSNTHIQPSARFPTPHETTRNSRQSTDHGEGWCHNVQSPDTRHAMRLATTEATHQQAAYCNSSGPGFATLPATIQTSHCPAPHTKTGPARAGKHTAVVPFGSHPTGSGWLGQGGSSAADAPVRRATPPSPSPVGLPSCICASELCVSELMYIFPLSLQCVLSSILVCTVPVVNVVSCQVACLYCRFIAAHTHTPIIVRQQLTINKGLLKLQSKLPS